MQDRNDVSANMLAQGVAVLGEGLTARSLQLWEQSLYLEGNGRP